MESDLDTFGNGAAVTQSGSAKGPQMQYQIDEGPANDQGHKVDNEESHGLEQAVEQSFEPNVVPDCVEGWLTKDSGSKFGSQV